MHVLSGFVVAAADVGWALLLQFCEGIDMFVFGCIGWEVGSSPSWREGWTDRKGWNREEEDYADGFEVVP